VKVPAKIEGTEATVIIATGRIRLAVKLEGKAIGDGDAGRAIGTEQALLIRPFDGLSAQCPNACLQQISDQEFLQVGPCQIEAVTLQQVGQPGRAVCSRA
jgi:hypothetical protein